MSFLNWLPKAATGNGVSDLSSIIFLYDDQLLYDYVHKYYSAMGVLHQ